MFPASTPCAAAATVDCLGQMLYVSGLHDMVVSYNGLAFGSEVYKVFLRRNGIREIFVPPYHPASNTAAERMVFILKQKLKKADSGDGLYAQLARMLLAHRTIPPEVPVGCPIQLLMGRRVKSALDMFRHDLRTTMISQQITVSLQ